MENKFNNLGSKEWLPFQKSFTLYAEKESLIRDNLRFFTKPSIHYKPNVGVFGNEQYKMTVQKVVCPVSIFPAPYSQNYWSLPKLV